MLVSLPSNRLEVEIVGKQDSEKKGRELEDVLWTYTEAWDTKVNPDLTIKEEV